MNLVAGPENNAPVAQTRANNAGVWQRDPLDLRLNSAHLLKACADRYGWTAQQTVNLPVELMPLLAFLLK